jgi:hypothetical protein|tara:strand:+ start:964 stop:1197 length:234 start_codon:yes stop_codon:yes gene_type:complete
MNKFFKYFVTFLCLSFALFSCDSDETPETPCLADSNPDLICIEIYEPVCGCDDITYSNSCYAKRAGVVSWTEGECKN